MRFNMATGIRRHRRWLCGVMWCALMTGGCSTPASDPLAEIYDLADIPLSDELQPAIMAGLKALASPEPTGREVDDLAAYRALEPLIDDPSTRHEAGVELFARWRAEPTNLLWLQLAMRNRHLLGNSFDFKAMFDDPSLVDQSRGPGAFLAGLRNYRRHGGGDEYSAARRSMATLPPVDQALLNLKLSIVMKNQGELDEAIALLLSHLPEVRVSAGCLMEAMYWRYISSFLRQDGRLDDALHANVLSIAMWNKVDCQYEALNARRKLARILAARIEYGAALVVLDAIIAEAENQKFSWVISKGLNVATSICLATGDRERALQYSLVNLDMSRAANDSLSVPRIMVNVANILRSLNRLPECRVYLDSAKVWVDAFGDPETLREFPMQEVPYYLHIGNYAEATRLIEQARGRLADSVLATAEAAFHVEQIQFAVEMGQPDWAYQSIARVQDLQTALKDGLPDANVLADYEFASAELFARQGEFRRAAASLARAARAVSTKGGAGKAWELDQSRGRLAMARADADSAEFYLERSLAVANAAGNEAQIADSQILLARHYMAVGDPRRARTLFTAVGAGNEFGPRFRTRLSAHLYRAISFSRTGEHERAIDGYLQVLHESNQYSPPDLRTRLQLEYARSLAAIGRLHDAEEAGHTARNILIETLRGSMSPEMGRASRGLWRELNELMIGLYLDNPGLLPGQSVARYTFSLLAMPSHRSENISENSELRSSCETRVENTPQLVFFVGERRSFRWLIGEHCIDLTALPGRARILSAAASVIADIDRPGRPVDQAARKNLSVMLLDGITDLWHRDQQLNLTPDDILQAVPWSALLVEDPGTPNILVPVVEYGAISESPSFDLASRRPPRRNHPPQTGWPSLLVLGNNSALDDQEGDRHLTNLEYAEDEARSIAGLWAGHTVELRVGRESAVLKPTDWEQFDVIHIASHAQVTEGAPQQSTLRLASSDSGQPITASGLARLSMKADLVFLSCCETARPLSPGGGGLKSLAQAYLTAGAKTVIASSQLINDESAGEFAKYFYRNWLSGEPKSQALRHAQLELRQARPEWAHPYFWATYHLLGDGS